MKDYLENFFAAIMSLQQTGNLNEKSMGAIADSISQKIVAKPIQIYIQ